jgi:prepilin-type N-terminal cleavage/methylation domain-containing protein
MNGLAKRGYSLVELLVAMIVALVLAALVASAISAARTSQKAAATRATIAKLGQILETQLDRYASRPVSMAGLPTTGSGAPLMSRNAYRAWYLHWNTAAPNASSW